MRKGVLIAESPKDAEIERNKKNTTDLFINTKYAFV